MRKPLMLVLVFAAMGASVQLIANQKVLAQDQGNDAAHLVDAFRTSWAGAVWEPPSGRRAGYLRPIDDGGWKQRMRALQGLVQMGPAATQPLRKSLASDDAAVRALAAQALGLVKAQEARADLEKAAEHDDDAAVRLTAVDALGMIGGNESDELLGRLQKSEQNRDAKQHVTYALERNGAPLDDRLTAPLKQWDAKQLDSAKVGQAAPDFALPSLSDERIRLSDFRGKKAVVLVFVYGDT